MTGSSPVTAPGEILEQFKGGYLSIAEAIDALETAFYPGAAQQPQLTEYQKDTLRRIDNAKAAGINLDPFWLDLERALIGVTSTHQSAPQLRTSHNSGEQLPNGDAAGCGADTVSRPHKD